MDSLWQRCAAAWGCLTRLQRWLLNFRWGRTFFRALKGYEEHGCVFITGALSFYAVVSLIPLAFISFWLLTVILGSGSASQLYLRDLLAQYLLPNWVDRVVAQVNHIADRGLVVLLGAWWGVLAFAWAGLRFYELLHNALSTAWGGVPGRPFLQRKLWTVLAFIVAALLFGSTILLTTALTALRQIDQYLPGMSLQSLEATVVKILPWVISVTMMFLLYKFMPNTHVPWKLALAAAVPVGLVWELSKRLFTSLVVSSDFVRDIYGPMASFVILMIWVYWSSVIVLFTAEYAAAWQQEGLKPPADEIPSPT